MRLWIHEDHDGVIARSSKYDNEPSCPIKHDVLEQPKGYQFLEMTVLHIINWLIDHTHCLQPTVHDGSSVADFSTVKRETIRSSETLVHPRFTRYHIPEYGILQGVFF